MKSITAVLLTAGVIAGTGLSSFAATTTNGEVEKNKQMARAWWEEVIVKENLKPLDTILDKNATMEMDPSYPSKVTGTSKLKGAEQIKQHAKNYTSIAETSGTITDFIGDGNTVILVRNVTMKLPAGTAKDVPWVTVFHFKNGKITDIQHIHDTAFERSQMTKK
jgi:ketosteroid isomerase-like protein